jgi:FAD/FMN-containing dehydrogenase
LRRARFQRELEQSESRLNSRLHSRMSRTSDGDSAQSLIQLRWRKSFECGPSASAAPPRWPCASSTGATNRPSTPCRRRPPWCLPRSTTDVADAVKLASAHEVPVIPFGVGSSLEGHLLAVQGGISIDVSRMNRVLSINAEDLTVTVQPGVTRKAAQRGDQEHRPVLPHRPRRRRHDRRHGATRASGTNAVRYGTMRENVLALEVVTASGEVIRTGTRAKKSAPATT